MNIMRKFTLPQSTLKLLLIFSIILGANKLAFAEDTLQTAVFGGGCFWGVDAVFKHVKGVTEVVSGYSGGSESTADYETVSTGKTGHAESVQIRFDPKLVSYSQLLQVFFKVAHNPTMLNHQGPDSGTQYRSVIFYMDESQFKTATDLIHQLTTSHVFPSPIVTQLTPYKKFYPAESYHQNYLALHPYQPYIVINDMPKIEHLKENFPDLYH